MPWLCRLLAALPQAGRQAHELGAWSVLLLLSRPAHASLWVQPSGRGTSCLSSLMPRTLTSDSSRSWTGFRSRWVHEGWRVGFFG